MFLGSKNSFLTSDLRFDQFYAKWGSKRVFLGSKMDKTLLPVNDRNVHAMSLDICFWCQKDDIFLHMLQHLTIFTREGGQKKHF